MSIIMLQGSQMSDVCQDIPATQSMSLRLFYDRFLSRIRIAVFGTFIFPIPLARDVEARRLAAESIMQLLKPPS